MGPASDMDVQSNLILVPFHYIEDIYMCFSMGAKVETLALACKTTCPVIEAIIAFKKKNALRSKLGSLFLKGPA